MVFRNAFLLIFVLVSACSTTPIQTRAISQSELNAYAVNSNKNIFANLQTIQVNGTRQSVLKSFCIKDNEFHRKVDDVFFREIKLISSNKYKEIVPDICSSMNYQFADNGTYVDLSRMLPAFRTPKCKPKNKYSKCNRFFKKSTDGSYYFYRAKFKSELLKALENGRYNENYNKKLNAINDKYINANMIVDKALKKKADDDFLQAKIEQSRIKREEATSAVLNKKASVLFSKLSKDSKEVGQKVCSSSNEFGYVERINNSRIQIRLAGKAKIEDRNFFFRKDAARYKYEIDTSIIWDLSKHWANCSFNRG